MTTLSVGEGRKKRGTQSSILDNGLLDREKFFSWVRRGEKITETSG